MFMVWCIIIALFLDLISVLPLLVLLCIHVMSRANSHQSTGDTISIVTKRADNFPLSKSLKVLSPIYIYTWGKKLLFNRFLVCGQSVF